MITRGTRFLEARVPIARILITEHQARYPERLLHYHTLLTEYPDLDCGPITLAPTDVPGASAGWFFTILDGHHRFLAHVLAGRSDVLALIETTDGQSGFGAGHAPIVLAQ